MDVKQTIGARISRLRSGQGLTQEELAERIGINPKYLSSIERGKENPTLQTLIKTSEALDVDFSEMFNLLQSEDQIATKDYIISMIEQADEDQLRTIFIIIKGTMER